MSNIKEEITRLDELHAKTTPGEWFHVSEIPDRQDFCDQPPAQHAVSIDGFDTPDIVAFTGDEIDAEDDAVCIAEMHNAWPAISAELTRLRDFETAVREAMTGAKHDYERVGEVSIAIDDLDRKRGGHEST